MSIKRLTKSLILCSSFCFISNHALAKEKFSYPKTPEESQKLIKELTPKAENGDAQAQNALGLIYGTCKPPENFKMNDHYGLSKLVDYSNCDRNKSAYWYKKSANLNYQAAQFHMGSLYAHGLGVKKNYLQAKNWYLKCIRPDDTKKNKGGVAFFFISKLYEEGGYGLQKDPKQAAYWCQKARKAGFPC